MYAIILNVVTLSLPSPSFLLSSMSHSDWNCRKISLRKEKKSDNNVQGDDGGGLGLRFCSFFTQINLNIYLLILLYPPPNASSLIKIYLNVYTWGTNIVTFIFQGFFSFWKLARGLKFFWFVLANGGTSTTELTFLYCCWFTNCYRTTIFRFYLLHAPLLLLV